MTKATRETSTGVQDTPGHQTDGVDLTVVLPCLNESDTLADCIRAARDGIERAGVRGEVVVADNGSTDGSRKIARSLGARVVPVQVRGYGAALMGGITEARGTWIIMGDADLSYDFGEIPRFVEQLRQGYDLVQGCRLPSGGGSVLPGAMPFLHRWWGNPMFSFMARWWFKTPIHDIHCGMRGFRRQFVVELDQRCTGMEFASEMIIKATLARGRIAEVPITLHPDGRVSHSAHLRTFRDGWRHLRFFLMYSPRWLFWLPGLTLTMVGIVALLAGFTGASVGPARLDVHTMLFGSLAVIVGYQAIVFAVFTKVFGIIEGFLPADPRMNRMFELVDLEKGLLAGALGLGVGLVLLVVAANQWRLAGFGDLDYTRTMRWVIPGALLCAVGVQTVLSSFFLSIMGTRRD
jgi:glycosyltransferase involved in cell wall biosynthesis